MSAILRGFGAGDGLARLNLGLRRARRGFRVGVPDRLFLAPQEIAQADPTLAIDIYSGHIILAGRSAMTRGESPFLVDPPSPAWAAELHGFEWLRHFQASDNAVVRQHARALLSEWLVHRNHPQKPLWKRPAVTARRTVSWLVNSPLLLTGADHGFYRAMLRALAADASRLEVYAHTERAGTGRLLAAIAWATYVLCALSSEREWKRASRALSAALAGSILADGTPLSRNPRDAIEAASMLLPLRNAYTARGRTPPPELQTAIDRLMAFLRQMRHPGGELALFNGMGATRIDVLGALFAFDDSAGSAPRSAPHGGYMRMEGEDAVAMVDIGAVPPGTHAYDASASALAFEFSTRGQRIVVSCGAPPSGLDDLREALRETAAFSALAVEGMSAYAFVAGSDPEGLGRRRLTGRTDLTACERSAGADGERLTLASDIWMRTFGFTHTRQLVLSADGSTLMGTDAVASAGRRRKLQGVPVLRFHLHPSIIASEDGELTIRLTLPDGSAWQFTSSDQAPALEDSIFFGGLEVQRRTRQIVVPLSGTDQTVTWAFHRLS